jgi:hypothetical protein
VSTVKRDDDSFGNHVHERGNDNNHSGHMVLQIDPVVPYGPVVLD